MLLAGAAYNMKGEAIDSVDVERRRVATGK
jgi:hypothetical protein